MDRNAADQASEDRDAPSQIEIAGEVDSVTLARLLEEVRNGDAASPTSYNRMHNRHNRS